MPLDELDLKISDIPKCSAVLDKFLTDHVEDHYLWLMEPDFNSIGWHDSGRAVFDRTEWHKIHAEVEKYAGRMATYLLSGYTVFADRRFEEFGAVCPHCQAIHTGEFIVEDGVWWACRCRECQGFIMREKDMELDYGV
jgi:Zn ribbon nucleic-acid-binding protein